MLANHTNTETARYSDNLLNSFCNFNTVHSWNIVSGAEFVSPILNSSLKKYAGNSAINIPFIGSGETIFNAGGEQMLKGINKDGVYLLSYRLFKSNDTSSINLKVQVYVNDVLFPVNTLEQTLHTDEGFVDGEWNTYFQQLELVNGDVLDFAFSVESDETGVNLFIDGLKLELNDRNLNVPSVYSEVPLEEIVEENFITIPTIVDGGFYKTSFTLQGAKTNPKDYIVMTYPDELLDLNLSVSLPSITSDGNGEFIITNNSGVDASPTALGNYKFKVLR